MEKNIKTGQIISCECYDREMSYEFLVTEVSDKTITGRLNYSSSAYGSAVVTDHLEKGKIITLNWDDITSFKVYDDEKTAEQIKKASKKRIEYTKTLIKGEGQLMQSIDMEHVDDSISVEMVSTLPYKDTEGVPELCKCWYRFGKVLSRDKVNHALTERFNSLSASGVILPQTKLTFRSKGFSFEGTLESGVVICAGVIPDELLSSINLFLDEARGQYGKAA